MVSPRRAAAATHADWGPWGSELACLHPSSGGVGGGGGPISKLSFPLQRWPQSAASTSSTAGSKPLTQRPHHGTPGNSPLTASPCSHGGPGSRCRTHHQPGGLCAAFIAALGRG